MRPSPGAYPTRFCLSSELWSGVMQSLSRLFVELVLVQAFGQLHIDA